MSRRFLIACLLLLFGAGLAYALTTASPRGPVRLEATTETLATRVKALRDGDTLVLAPGNYGAFRLASLQFTRPVTITSAKPADPASFSLINVANSANVRLVGLTVRFVPDAATTTSDSAVRVITSNRIDLIGLKIVGGMAVSGVHEDTPAGGQGPTRNIIGWPTARGITIMRSNAVKIEANDISVFFRGIVLTQVRNIVVRGNYVHHLRTSPLVGGDVSDTLVEGNIFSDSTPWKFSGPGDHGDLIHFWTAPQSQSQPSARITIRSNWLRQGAGQAMLGIYIDDDKNGIGYRDVVIENNLIHNDNHQGIRLENVQGRVARNTLVQPASEFPKRAPGIIVTDNSIVSIEDNVLASISETFGGRSTQSGNFIVQRRDPRASGYYASVFRNGLNGGRVVDDFSLRAAPTQTQLGVDTVVMRRAMSAGL